MKRYLIAVFLLTFALSACEDQAAMLTDSIAEEQHHLSAGKKGSRDAQPAPAGHFLVEFRGDAASLSSSVEAQGGTVMRHFPEIGLAQIGGLTDAQAARLARERTVSAVNRDLVVQWVPRVEELQARTVAAPASHTSINPPDAFFYPCQWNLRQIDAPGAWAQDQFGSPDVKVAVLDTGIDPFHIDLENKVDVTSSTSLLSPDTSPCGAPDEDTIFDLNFHGSFVASQITSNGIGIAAVAPLTQVVGVKVLNCDGSGSFGDVIAGIVYAANQPDVEIVNLSLGAYFPRNLPGAGPLVAALNKAVNYANSRGKLVVSAAGNLGENLDRNRNFIQVPAESGAGISIYATNMTDGLASYSNHGVSGTWVGAPGGDFPNPNPPLPGCVIDPVLQSLVLGVCSSFVCGDPDFYLVADGTSFASPVAAGVAALIDARHGGRLNGAQLKTRLAQSADDLGRRGVDNLFSHGRVNAARAVQR